MNALYYLENVGIQFLSLRHYPISGFSLPYQFAHVAAGHETLFWLPDMRGYYASPSAGRDVGCDKFMRRIAEGDMIYPAFRSLVGGLFVYLQSIVCSIAQQPFSAPAPIMPPSLPPSHVADLMTSDGSAAFGAIWRVMEAKPVEVPASPEAKPQYKTTHQISPRAGAKGFDDSSWPIVAPTDLGARIGGGHMSFMWYRATLTIPPKIGNFDTTDTQAVLRVLVDDYAEIWINGDIPRRSGYPSPATIQGLNMPNRVVLGTAVKPGDKFEVAVFGINGPISIPRGTIWFREAKVEFFK